MSNEVSDANVQPVAMKNLIGLFASLFAVVQIGCAQKKGVTSVGSSGAAEFVGSTPGDALVRDFLGGLPTNATVHAIRWSLNLSTNASASSKGKFSLTALYKVPTAHNPNLSQDGPRIDLDGSWEILPPAKGRVGEKLYRLKGTKSGRAVSLVQLGDDVFQFLNADGTFAIGNGGQSYTLYRAAAAEQMVDPAQAMSAPDMSYRIAPMSSGPEVFGVFEGRSPCHGIANELGVDRHAGCMKAKWRVTLYQDPKTSAPARYKIEGTLFRPDTREGTWKIGRGTALDPNATVYELGAALNQPELRLVKGDDNVLFFLTPKRQLRVGHAEFSYTLNRAGPK